MFKGKKYYIKFLLNLSVEMINSIFVLNIRWFVYPSYIMVITIKYSSALKKFTSIFLNLSLRVQ